MPRQAGRGDLDAPGLLGFDGGCEGARPLLGLLGWSSSASTLSSLASTPATACDRKEPTPHFDLLPTPP
jgi:hypothetical protein